MSSIIIRDLHDALTLDSVSLKEIRGGFFGFAVFRLAGYGTSSGTSSNVATSDIKGESTDKQHPTD